MAEAPVPESLLEVREKIDEVDHKLVLLLADRFALTRHVGQLKAKTKMEALDPDRESQKLESLRSISVEHGLDPDLIAELFSRIMKEVVKNHRQIRESSPEA